MTAQALDWITIKGFRSIRAIERLELRPINVVIGANGSGKSNFINSFAFLHEIREGRLQQYVRERGGAEQILYFGSRTTKKLSLHVSFMDEVNQYSINLHPTDDDTLYPDIEAVYYWDKSKYPQPWNMVIRPNGLEAGISKPQSNMNTADYVRARLAMWRVYHVHDTSAQSPMRKTSNINDNRFLRSDGSNLAAFLYLLKEKYPDAYHLIRDTIKQATPFFDDFVLEPDPLNQESIRLEWRHIESDKYFGPSAFSDGSLRFIALATLFLQPERLRPSVILVDEPELGLHPFAIALLASLIQQSSMSTQVIVSTQSSLLLDHFSPEDVLVAERVKSGTQLTRLKPDQLSVWLKDYSLGQLWEKNELGGRPRPE